MTNQVPLYTPSGTPDHLLSRPEVKKLAKELRERIKKIEATTKGTPAARKAVHGPHVHGYIDLFDATEIITLRQALPWE